VFRLGAPSSADRDKILTAARAASPTFDGATEGLRFDS
jgi:hypothetical protein